MGDDVGAEKEQGGEQRDRNDADQEVRERQAQGQPPNDHAKEGQAGPPQEDAGRLRDDESRDDPPAPDVRHAALEEELGADADGEDDEPDARGFSKLHGARILATARRVKSATIARDVRFLRQAALLLPSAFLLNVLVFLLTHGRDDPGFGAYPFFQSWAGDAPTAPESRFFEQSLVFFVPAYVLALLLILGVTLAERSLFGAAAAAPSLAVRPRLRRGVPGALFRRERGAHAPRRASGPPAGPGLPRSRRCSQRRRPSPPGASRSFRRPFSRAPSRFYGGSGRHERAATVDRHPGLRGPVHAADRAARPGRPRLLGRPAARRSGRRDSALEPGGHHPVGRPPERVRGGFAPAFRRSDRLRRSGPRALLRDAVARSSGWRRGRQRGPRVRPRARPDRRDGLRRSSRRSSRNRPSG